MTTIPETKTAKTKHGPDFYIFDNGTDGTKSGKPVGAAFVHKKGIGFAVLIAGKRYVAFPPKVKPVAQGEGA